MPTYVIPTSAATHIGKRLDRVTGPRLAYPEVTVFPNKERRVRIPSVESIYDRAAVLHSGEPDPDSGLQELRECLAALEDSAAKRVEVFLAYPPYGRQDKDDPSKEKNMALDLILELLDYRHVDVVHTIDAHFALQDWASGLAGLRNISAFPMLKRRVQRDNPSSKVIFVGADKGAKRRLGLEYAFEKERIDGYTVKITVPEELQEAIRGNVIAVSDDVISTGGTLIKIGEAAAEHKPKKLIALATHLESKEGIQRILRTYDRMYAANTTSISSRSPRVARVDVAPLIWNAIRNGSA